MKPLSFIEDPMKHVRQLRDGLQFLQDAHEHLPDLPHLHKLLHLDLPGERCLLCAFLRAAVVVPIIPIGAVTPVVSAAVSIVVVTAWVGLVIASTVGVVPIVAVVASVRVVMVSIHLAVNWVIVLSVTSSHVVSVLAVLGPATVLPIVILDCTCLHRIERVVPD